MVATRADESTWAIVDISVPWWQELLDDILQILIPWPAIPDRPDTGFVPCHGFTPFGWDPDPVARRKDILTMFDLPVMRSFSSGANFSCWLDHYDPQGRPVWGLKFSQTSANQPKPGSEAYLLGEASFMAQNHDMVPNGPGRPPYIKYLDDNGEWAIKQRNIELPIGTDWVHRFWIKDGVLGTATPSVHPFPDGALGGDNRHRLIKYTYDGAWDALYPLTRSTFTVYGYAAMPGYTLSGPEGLKCLWDWRQSLTTETYETVISPKPGVRDRDFGVKNYPVALARGPWPQ